MKVESDEAYEEAPKQDEATPVSMPQPGSTASEDISDTPQSDEPNLDSAPKWNGTVPVLELQHKEQTPRLLQAPVPQASEQAPEPPSSLKPIIPESESLPTSIPAAPSASSLSTLPAHKQSEALPSSTSQQDKTTPEPEPKRTGLRISVRILTFLVAIVSVFLGAVDCVRAVNPSLLSGENAFIGFLSHLYPVIPALVCGLFAFIVAFITKIVSGKERRKKLTTAAMLLSILGILLSGAAFTTTHIFPEGMIHPVTTSTAPLNDSEELGKRIDWAFGECDSGWATIDPARFDGVSYINVCASTSTLFVAYDSHEQAVAYEGIMAGKAADYIESSMGTTMRNGEFSALTGDQWMIVGHVDGTKKLQSLWGGTIEPVTSPKEARIRSHSSK